jgi:hypothetical protein
MNPYDNHVLDVIHELWSEGERETLEQQEVAAAIGESDSELLGDALARLAAAGYIESTGIPPLEQARVPVFRVRPLDRPRFNS